MELKPDSPRRSALDQLVLFGYYIAALAAANSLTWKMGNDQAVYTAIAQTILDGGIPYRDAWDMRGPLTYYTYALALSIWNRPGLSIRIFDLLALACCCVMLRQLVTRTVKDAAIANSTPIIFLLMYFSLGYWNTAQPDGWAAIIVLGVVLLLVNPPWRATASMAVAGILVAAATLINPTFAAYLALPIFFPCIPSGEMSYPIRSVAACVAAFGVTTTIPMALIANAIGGVGDLFDICRFFMTHGSLRIPLRILWTPYFLAYVVPIILAVIGVLILHRSTDRRLAGLISTWGAICVAVTAIQGKYYTYHFISLLVSMIVPIAVTIHATSSLYRNRLRVAAFALTIGPLAIYSLYDRDSSYSYERPQAAVAAYVVTHSGSHENILVWSGELQPVYALSQRKPPTRFLFSYPLIADSPVRAKYRSIFIREIVQRPPCYVIFDSQNGLKSASEFPEFNELLHTRYAVATQIGANQVWQLKQSCRMRTSPKSLKDEGTVPFGPWSR